MDGTSVDSGYRMLHTMLRVGDLDKSIDFYTRLLGMKLLRKRDVPAGKYTLAFVGAGGILVAKVGFSGGTKLGDLVVIGGQAGLAGHLQIGDRVRIAAKAGLIRDVEPGATLCGYPALPAVTFWRQTAFIQRLAKKRTGDE